MNETIRTILQRYSCRGYTDRPPDDEQLRAIADAALASPSAVNRQNWRVIIVRDKGLIHELEAEGLRVLETADPAGYERIRQRGGKLFYDAPCIIFIPIDTAQHMQENILDCGIVSQNIALAAASLGLGNVICGLARMAFLSDKKEYFKQKLGFPPGYEFGMSVLIGYPAVTKEPHEPDPAKVRYIG